MTTTQGLLTPPTFADEDKTRKARWLNIFMLAAVALLSLFLLFRIFLNGEAFDATNLILISEMLLMGGLLIAIRRGYVQESSFVLTTATWLALTLIALNSEGVGDPAFLGYVIVILLASLFIGWRTAVFFAFLSIASGWVMAYLETTGAIVAVPDPATEFARDATVIFALIALLIYLTIDSLRRALDDTRQSNQQLQTLSAQLEQRVINRTRDLELAVDVSRSVAGVRDLDKLLKDAVNLIRSRFNLYYTQIYLVDESQLYLSLHAGTGSAGQKLVQSNHQLRLNNQSVCGGAALKKEPVIVANTQTSRIFQPNPLLPDTRSEAAIALIAGDRVVGVLDLQSDQPDTFSQETLPAFKALAGQLAIAIENARLFTEISDTNQATRRERGLLTSLINSVPDLIFYKDLNGVYLGCNTAFSEFSGKSPEELTGLTDFDLFPEEVAAFFREQDEAMMAKRESRSNEEWVDYPDGRRVLLDTLKTPFYDADDNLLGLIGISRNVTHRKRTEFLLGERVKELNLLNDLGRKVGETPPMDEFLAWVAERIPPGMQYPDICTAAVTLEENVYGDPQALELPTQIVEGIRIGQELLGRIYIAYTEPTDFLNEESALIGDIGRRVSNYIESRRLIEEVESRAEELQKVTEISTAVAITRDPHKLLQEMADQTKTAFGLYHAQIYLFDEQNQELVLTAGAGETGRQMVAERRTIPMQQEKSLVARAARERRGVIVNDVQADPGFLPHPLLPHTRSEMAIPMIAGNTLLGVLDVQGKIIDRFTEQDINIKTTLATQVAIALENANQYEQTQQALEEVSALQRAITGEGWRAFMTAKQRPVKGFIAADRQNIQPIRQNGQPETEAEGNIDLINLKKEAFVTPVSVSGASIGGLGVRLPTERSLSESEQLILYSISQQLGQALERARLSEQTQSALSEAEMLYEIGRRLNAAQTIDELIDAVVVPMTEGETAEIGASLFTFELDENEEPETITMISTNDPYQQPMVGQTLRMKDFPATQIWTKDPNNPLLISDTMADTRLDEQTRGLYQQLNMKSAAVLPLHLGTRWVGLFHLAWHDEQVNFTEEDARLYQTVNSQMTTAVNGFLLLEAAQSRAQREQILREISNSVNNAVDAESVLRTAAREIGQALNLETFVYLTDEEANGHPVESPTIQ